MPTGTGSTKVVFVQRQRFNYNPTSYQVTLLRIFLFFCNNFAQHFDGLGTIINCALHTSGVNAEKDRKEGPFLIAIIQAFDMGDKYC